MKVKRAALIGFALRVWPERPLPRKSPSMPRGHRALHHAERGHTPSRARWTFGVYGWKEQLVAGRPRVHRHGDAPPSLQPLGRRGARSASGLTDRWSVFASAGEEVSQSRGGWEGGALNSVRSARPSVRTSRARSASAAKYRFVPETSDSDFRLGSLGAPPASRSRTPRSHKDEVDADLDRIKTRRTDWDGESSGTKGIVTRASSPTSCPAGMMTTSASPTGCDSGRAWRSR